MSKQLDREFARVRVSKQIDTKFTTMFCANTTRRQQKKCVYEAKNILERFLLSMSNSSATSTDPVYKKCDLRNAYVKKLIHEIVEKKAFTSSTSSPIPLSTAKQMFHATIKPSMDSFLNVVTFPTVRTHKTSLTDTDIIFTYEDQTIVMPVSRSILNVLRAFDKTRVSAMMLRYSSILVRGQQWGVSQRQYNDLYTTFGIHYEGFASPLNSRLMGKPDAKFCSLFMDTDRYFGSMGPFFEVDMLRPTGKQQTAVHWTVNPPYVDDILVRSAKKVHQTCLEAARSTTTKFMAFFIMPGWIDSKCYEILHNSRFKRQEIKLLPRTYVYEYQNKWIVATFTSYVFVLDTYDDKKDYTHICKQMRLSTPGVLSELNARKSGTRSGSRRKRYSRKRAPTKKK